jgi:hypothetical protein
MDVPMYVPKSACFVWQQGEDEQDQGVPEEC